MCRTQSSIRDEDVCVSLKNIPPNEQWVLEYFFRQLLLRDGGAYVLNGTKPAALGDFGPPSLREVPFFGWRFFRTNSLLKKGCETWKKYQHLFPHGNYTILCLEDQKSNGCHIALINNKQFICIIEENIEDFRAVLGSKMSASSLLEGLAKKEQTLYQLLQDHSGLLGIILGYGKHNASLFYQRALIENQINTCQFAPKKFDLIEAKFNALNVKLQPVNQTKPSKLLFALSPAFIFDPHHPETQKLLTQYTRQKKEFTTAYGRGNFLETTLRNLQG